MKNILAVGLAFFIFCPFIAAQDSLLEEMDVPPLISGDRPGYGVSTMNVPKGLFQVEAGYQLYLRNYKNLGINDRIHSVPVTLRYGIIDWLEVKSDIAYSKDVFESQLVQEYEGINPIALGLRATVLEQTDVLPRVLLYGTVAIPVDEQQSTTSDLRLLITKQITDIVSLDVNAGAILGETNSLHYAISGSASVSDGISFFAEYYGIFSEEIHSGFIDGGLVFFPANNFQIDLSAGSRVFISSRGVPLRADYSEAFVTVGFAYRLPK